MFNYSDFVVLYFRNLTEQSNNKKTVSTTQKALLTTTKKDFKQLSAFFEQIRKSWNLSHPTDSSTFSSTKVFTGKIISSNSLFCYNLHIATSCKTGIFKKSASKVGFRCTIYFTRGLCYLNCRKAPERCSTKSEATKEASLCKPAKISPDKPCI